MNVSKRSSINTDSVTNDRVDDLPADPTDLGKIALNSKISNIPYLVNFALKRGINDGKGLGEFAG